MVKEDTNMTSKNVEHLFIKCNSDSDRIDKIKYVIQRFNKNSKVIIFTE